MAYVKWKWWELPECGVKKARTCLHPDSLYEICSEEALAFHCLKSSSVYLQKRLNFTVSFSTTKKDVLYRSHILRIEWAKKFKSIGIVTVTNSIVLIKLLEKM